MSPDAGQGPGARERGAARPVRFGFLGVGRLARRALAPAVHAADGARLQAVAAREAAPAAELEPAGRVYDDYRAVLDDPEVDVVYVTLGRDQHREWTLAALTAGKHVLCEKPLGLHVTDVAEMLAAARAADRLLVEAMEYRWHPRTRRLEQLLRLGALGPVRWLRAEFSFGNGDDPRTGGNDRLTPAPGGGALYGVGGSTISAAHLVLGPRLVVERATGRIGSTGADLAVTAWLAVPTVPTAWAWLRCAITGPDRQQLQVGGDAAVVDFVAGDAFTSWRRPSSLTITTPDGSVRLEEFAPVDAYRLMVQAVATRVRGEESFLVGPEHSLQVAATLDAVRAGLT